MSRLLINRIHIELVILLTLVISAKAKQPTLDKRFIENAKISGNFTTIDFLKTVDHFQPTYKSVLILKNQNATISSIFYTRIMELMDDRNHNIIAQKRFNGLSKISLRTFVKILMDSLLVPVLQFSELQSFYLKRFFNENFLTVVYIDIEFKDFQTTFNDHKVLLDKLSENLLHMTTSKVLFLLNFPMAIEATSGTTATVHAKIDEGVVQSILVKLFYYCWQQKIINVVALLADYQITRTFYSFTHFPKFKMETKQIALHLANQEEIYPNRLADLKGYKLSIVIGGTDPRIVPYKTSKGQYIIGGFVGHFITAFAGKYNCTLVQPSPFKPHDPIPSKDLIQAVRNGTAEISIGMLNPGTSLTGFARPIQLLNWCILLPVEANIPDYKFFTLVFKGNTFILVLVFALLISTVLTAALYVHGYHAHLADIVFRGDCLRGILGQPFSEVTSPPKIVRFIYLKTCVFGLLLTTSYTTHLSTYVTHSPKEPALKSYDDILWSGLKIVVWEAEYISMGVSENYKQYSAIFHLVQDYKEFLKLRDSFNTSYGYVVPDTKWIIIRQQQKMFTTPLFRICDNLCLVSTTPMSFPVHENSLYTPLINRVILQASQSGLFDFWIQYAFLEMVMAKKLKFDDLSAKRKFKAMSFDDLRYVMVFLGCMYVIIFLVFMCEQLVFYGKRIKEHVRDNISLFGNI